MKKLMIAAAIVCAAAMAQAVTFKWASSDAGYAIDPSSIKGKDNGNYSVGSTTGMDAVGTFTYILTIYSAQDGTMVGSVNGDVTFGAANGKYQFSATDVEGTSKSTAYKYVLEITGSQSDIRALGEVAGKQGDVDGTFDYSAASLYWSSGMKDITTKSSGATSITDLPTSFQVTGITFTAAPEPTSGLLLLLGVGALALRRRRA